MTYLKRVSQPSVRLKKDLLRHLNNPPSAWEPFMQSGPKETQLVKKGLGTPADMVAVGIVLAHDFNGILGVLLSRKVES